ncbi:hypothetical protein V1522DRAFT_424056 [Lipomyces starkeyi]
MAEKHGTSSSRSSSPRVPNSIALEKPTENDESLRGQATCTAQTDALGMLYVSETESQVRRDQADLYSKQRAHQARKLLRTAAVSTTVSDKGSMDKECDVHNGPPEIKKDEELSFFRGGYRIIDGTSRTSTDTLHANGTIQRHLDVDSEHSQYDLWYMSDSSTVRTVLRLPKRVPRYCASLSVPSQEPHSLPLFSLD